jgi:hypothetical protein
MDAIFVIPTLISPNVPERLLPGLSKLVERNMLLNYSSQIKNAALRRYASLLNTATTENTNILKEDKPNPPNNNQSNKKKPWIDATKNSAIKVGSDLYTDIGAGGSKEHGYTVHTSKSDSVEYPRGITFFHNISLEPTILEIPVEVNRYPLGAFGTKSEKIIRIGMKCVPYQFDKIKDLKAALRNKNAKKLARQNFDTGFKSIKPKIIRQYRNIYRGNETTGDVINDILIGPSSLELSSPRVLSKLMKNDSPSRWTSLLVFTTFDFQDMELKELLKNYQNYVKQGWGDIIVVNEDKESIHFCMQKMMACQEIPYTYLRQMLNLDQVLDYKEISRLTKPFRVVPIRSALRDSCGLEYYNDNKTLNEQINEIIKE